MPGFPILHHLPELAQTHAHLIFCYPLLLLPSIFSSIRIFPNKSALSVRWPKYWSFSFSISPSNEHLGLISFRMECLDLLASKGLSKVFSSTTIWKYQFFSAQSSHMVQLSHLYMTPGKIIALTVRTFVGKVMSLLFNMLSRFVIAVLQRSKRLLISWLQSPSAVILKPRKIKSVTASNFSPYIIDRNLNLNLVSQFPLSGFVCDNKNERERKAS